MIMLAEWTAVGQQAFVMLCKVTGRRYENKESEVSDAVFRYDLIDELFLSDSVYSLNISHN